jgi:molybdopterin-guanine dinucleotide biosynthesis protein A
MADDMSAKPDNIAGAVLAGGKSRRMGRDKLSLRLDGATLLQRAASVLLAAMDEVLVVTDSPERVAGHGALKGVRIVADLVPGIGPLGGIQAALRASSCAAVLAVASDMPRLDAGVIAKLAALWCDGEFDALVPLVDGHPEPLHAVYSRRCLPAIETQIARGKYAVRGIFQHVRVRWWTPCAADAASLLNVNTPDEWSAVTDEAGRAKACGGQE